MTIKVVWNRLIARCKSPELPGSSAARTLDMIISSNNTTIKMGAITGIINPALIDNMERSESSPANRTSTHSAIGNSIEAIAIPISPWRNKPNDKNWDFKVEIMKLPTA
jgi:hypothetical protein